MRNDSGHRSPGVYYEETNKSGFPTRTLRTGVPLFVGLIVSENPSALIVDRAIFHIQRLGQLSCLLKKWGDKKSYLYQSVRGFFENGGHECFVFPVYSKQSSESAAKALCEAFAEDSPLEALDACDLICVPDVARLHHDLGCYSDVVAVQTAAIEYCNRMGDRLVILDVPETEKSENKIQHAIEHWQSLPAGNAALYFPYIFVAGLSHAIPSCGHIAGIYARTDERVGVHKAPANENIQGAVALTFGSTDLDQTSLNEAGVNCIRVFKGLGIRVWGARTLYGQPQKKYVHVVRLILDLNRWIVRNTKDFVFENNEPNVWGRLYRRLYSHCIELWQQGALAGNDAQRAFFVKCDGDINTPVRRQAGELIAEIGLAAVSPAEFVIVQIARNSSNLSIFETKVIN